MCKVIQNIKYVYCTNCMNFRLDDENSPHCCYEDKCNIKNCEDSLPIEERPYYKENKVVN